MQYDNETATEAINGTEPAFCISYTQLKVGDFRFMPYRATQTLHSKNIHTTLESCLVYNFFSIYDAQFKVDNKQIVEILSVQCAWQCHRYDCLSESQTSHIYKKTRMYRYDKLD